MSLADQLERLINAAQNVHDARAILFDSGGCAQRWITRALSDCSLAGTEAPHMAAVAVGMLVINGDPEVLPSASPRVLTPSRSQVRAYLRDLQVYLP